MKMTKKTLKALSCWVTSSEKEAMEIEKILKACAYSLVQKTNSKDLNEKEYIKSIGGSKIQSFGGLRHWSFNWHKLK